MPKALLISIAVALCATAQAQVDLRVSLSPPVVPFHQQATLSIVVEAPADLDVAIPDLRDHFGELAVYGTPDHFSEPVGEDRVRVTERYVLDPVHVKDHVWAPIEVTWGDGQSVVVPAPLFRARQLTQEELDQAAQFEGQLAGGVGAGSRSGPVGWLIAGAVAVLLAAGLFAAVLLRRPKPTAEELIEQAAWDLALERLSALAERQLPQKGRYDVFFVDLSAILRYYVEGRWELHAPERTTPEFLSEIAGGGHFTPEQEVFLARFLRLCDRVKFAQFRPDLEAMGVSFEETMRFVEETIPEPEPEGEAIAA